MEKGLDSGTAYMLLSIDIADINIGENIGATLQIDQAGPDLQVAKARAEKRRAMAIAFEQEMSARVQEARAKVIQAEAEIPHAMAGAFRKGTLVAGRKKLDALTGLLLLKQLSFFIFIAVSQGTNQAV